MAHIRRLTRESKIRAVSVARWFLSPEIGRCEYSSAGGIIADGIMAGIGLAVSAVAEKGTHIVCALGGADMGGVKPIHTLGNHNGCDPPVRLMGNQKQAIAGICQPLCAIGGHLVGKPYPCRANCFTQNQIARLFILVALKKNVRRPFCETAETIEHFILPMSHKR